MEDLSKYPDFESVEYHQVYSALIQAARVRGTVKYQELAHLVGLPLSGNFMSKRIGEILGAVSANEVNHGRPMLSAIAVLQEGRPGKGFFDFARHLGLLATSDPSGEAAFWEEQTRQIYDIWRQRFHNPKS